MIKAGVFLYLVFMQIHPIFWHPNLSWYLFKSLRMILADTILMSCYLNTLQRCICLLTWVSSHITHRRFMALDQKCLQILLSSKEEWHKKVKEHCITMTAPHGWAHNKVLIQISLQRFDWNEGGRVCCPWGKMGGVLLRYHNIFVAWLCECRLS